MVYPLGLDFVLKLPNFIIYYYHIQLGYTVKVLPLCDNNKFPFLFEHLILN